MRGKGKGEKQKKRALNKWCEERMKGAIEEYKEREANGFKPKLRVIARAWCVPKSTLQRRIKDKVKGHEHVSGRKRILSTE